MIFVTQTLLGEEKQPCQMRRSRVVAASSPWLIATPVERASACNAGHADGFLHSISGIECRTRTPPITRAPYHLTTPCTTNSDCQQHGSQLHYRNLRIVAYC